MVSLLGGLADLGYAYGGFERQQMQDAELRARRAQIQKLQDAAAAQALAGSGLAQLGGNPPPPAPPVPMGPGQASMPAQPSAATPAPPMQPGGAPPMAGAPIAPPSGQPPMAGAPPAPVGPARPPQGGMMTVDQMAKRIMAANPGVNWQDPQNQRRLFMAVQQNQQLLAPEAKAEMATLLLQNKIDQFNQTLQFKQLSEQDRMQARREADALRMQIVQMQQAGMDRRQTDKLDAALTVALTKLAGQEKLADKKEASMDRRSLVQSATKAGVSVDPAWDTTEIQSKTAEAIAKKAGQGAISDEAATFFAEAARKDPSVFSHLPRNQETRAKVMSAFTKLPGVQPEELAAAKVALQGAASEARKVGTIAGAAAVGAEELAPMGDLVTEMSNKVSRSKYPTLNAIELSIKRGTGDPDVVEFYNKVQSLKSAFTQVLTRGGVPGVEAQKRADELISVNMPVAQIGAAVKAMRQEAETVKGAAKRATGAITGRIMEKGGEKPAEAAPGSNPADPLGILE